MPGSFFNISVLHFLTISVIDRAGSSQLHVIQYMVKIFGGMTCTLASCIEEVKNIKLHNAQYYNVLT